MAGCMASPVHQTGEQLIAAPPAGWQEVYSINTETARLMEYIPPGQTRLDWTLNVSFESFASTDTDVIKLLIAEADREADNCSFVNHFALNADLENGYPTSVRLMFCGEKTTIGKGEAKLMKAMAGDEHVYVVRIVKRMAPFESGNIAGVDRVDMQAWTNYLRHIKLCNPKLTERPCPDPQ